MYKYGILKFVYPGIVIKIIEFDKTATKNF